MLAVKAQVRAGEFRTRNSIGETVPGNVATQITIVVRAFSEGKPKRVPGRDRGPRYSRRLELLGDLPLFALHSVNAPQVARSKPELAAMPRQRLRRWSRRLKTF